MNLRYFIIGFVGLLFIAMMLAAPSEQALNREKLSFHVLESDQLYFKNLRQFYYSTEIREDAGFAIHRPKNQEVDSLKPSLNFAIVVNDRQDEAYIMAEWYSPNQSDSILFEVNAGQLSQKYSLSRDNMQKHLELASLVFDAIQKEDAAFFLDSEANRIEIWPKRSDRNLIKRVLKDYFKLTGGLR